MGEPSDVEMEGNEEEEARESSLERVPFLSTTHFKALLGHLTTLKTLSTIIRARRTGLERKPSISLLFNQLDSLSSIMPDLLNTIDISDYLEDSSNPQQARGLADKLVQESERVGFFYVKGWERVVPKDLVQKVFEYVCLSIS
jgi:hypothetical protein